MIERKDKRIYSYNQSIDNRDNYSGALYVSIILASAYTSIISCKAIKKDLNERHEQEIFQHSLTNKVTK